MINHLYNGYKKELQNYKKIYDYYLGHTDALKNYVTTDRSNQMVGLNYLKKFVKEETAYSVGNPISYQSKTENFEATKELEKNLSEYNTVLTSVLENKKQISEKEEEMEKINIISKH